LATVRILRSTTAGNTPSALVSGQIAINEADGKIFYRNGSGTVTALATGGGSIDAGTYPLITISAQPSATTAAPGTNATFSLTATATLPTTTLAYQWQQSANGSSWSNISGATSSSVTVASSSGVNGYYYRCLLTADLSSVYTSSAQLTVAAAFTPQAVLLTSGTSYTAPANASNVKIWAIGGGGANGGLSAFGGAGGTAYKTWNLNSGSTITYSVGAGGSAFASTSAALGGGNTTVTYGGVTITGFGGGGDVSGSNYSGGSFSGGDGGASGGSGVGSLYTGTVGYGGAVGGNGTPVSPCNRKPMTDISGLLAALSLAGVSTPETCATSAAFGSGAAGNKFGYKTAGLGGGGAGVDSSRFSWNVRTPGGAGAVVIYFT
jgi:hypothetical protein